MTPEKNKNKKQSQEFLGQMIYEYNTERDEPFYSPFIMAVLMTVSLIGLFVHSIIKVQQEEKPLSKLAKYYSDQAAAYVTKIVIPSGTEVFIDNNTTATISGDRYEFIRSGAKTTEYTNCISIDHRDIEQTITVHLKNGDVFQEQWSVLRYVDTNNSLSFSLVRPNGFVVKAQNVATMVRP